MTTPPSTPSGAEDPAAPSPRARIVLGVSGGIAAYKAAMLLRLLTEEGHDVTVVPTAAALRFVGEPTWSALSGHPVTSEVWDDVDQVRHVRLGQDADLVVVAPATADLLARAAHGLADDLLTNTLLTTRAPVLYAPAMHTEMWQHPATQDNVATLRSRGSVVIEPASGRLTGADSGPGRLPEPEDIHAACRELLTRRETRVGREFPGGPEPEPTAAVDPASRAPSAAGPESCAASAGAGTRLVGGTSAGSAAGSATASAVAGRSAAASAAGAPSALVDDPTRRAPMAGIRVVISAGGTREPLDPVRFLGNRSSGKQGYALADIALDRGASVTVVSANVSLPPPPGATVVRVESALDLREAIVAAARDADVVVMAAAVADFRPKRYVTAKIKKNVLGASAQPDLTLELVRNPDILAELVRSRGGDSRPLIVGFAAETGDDSGDVLHHARIKLAQKGCDLLVANEVGRDLTFGKDRTTVHILARGSQDVRHAGPGSKHAAASAVWDAVQDRLSQRR